MIRVPGPEPGRLSFHMLGGTQKVRERMLKDLTALV